MPTEREIQDYILLLNPLSPFDLPPHSRDCPICFEPYSPPTTLTPPHPFLDSTFSNTSEYPVSVQSQHPNSACRHVFGRRCIEKHFRSGGPWCTRCPTCREEWFEHDVEGDMVAGELAAREEAAVGAWGDGVEFVRIRVPREIMVRLYGDDEGVGAGAVLGEVDGDGDVNAGAEAGGDGNADNVISDVVGGSEEGRQSGMLDGRMFSNRGRLNRSIGFLERMLMTEEIDDGDLETNNRVVEVERAVERLYNRLETSGRERDEGSVAQSPRGVGSAGMGAVRILYA